MDPSTATEDQDTPTQNQTSQENTSTATTSEQNQTLESLKNQLNDPSTDFAQRDSEGRTLLHQAVLAQADPQMLKDLSDHVDIAVRDVHGDTVLDIVPMENAQLKEVLENKVKELVLTGGEEGEKEAQRLVLAGWSAWPVTAEEAKERSEEAVRILEKMMELKDKVDQVHKAEQEGRQEDLQQLLQGDDSSLLLSAADCAGLRPLQRAILHRQAEVVKFLASSFKDSVNVADHMGRTALHYAAAMSVQEPEFFQTLKEAGADESLQDLAGRTAADYQQSPDLLPVADILKKLEGGQTIASADDSADNKADDNGASAQVAADIAAEVVVDMQDATEDSQKSAQTEERPPSPKPAPKKYPTKPAELTPIAMYVFGGPKEEPRAPPPSTVDGRYVAQHLGSALTMALAEIVEKRPWDPVEYLAQWLYKYRENVDYLEKQKALLSDIRAEEENANAAEVVKFKRKEEERRIQEEERVRREEEEAARRKREQEEMQRQAKEALLAQKPQLPTVREEEGEDAMLRERDEQGQTELHLLAAQSGADLMAVMNLGYSLADRDASNKTARDLAEDQGLTENVDTIDNYVSNLLEQEKLDTVKQLVIEGYDHLQSVLDKVSTEGLPAAVTDFLASLPQLQERVKDMLEAASGGEVERVERGVGEEKGVALAKDLQGRSPLHLALLAGHDQVARALVQACPLALKARDNLNRTPLHYASALSEEMTDFLKASGADANAKDAKQHTPAFYADHKETILQLKPPSTTTFPSGTEQGTEQTGTGDVSLAVPQIQADDQDGGGSTEQADDTQATTEEKEEEEEEKEGGSSLATTS